MAEDQEGQQELTDDEKANLKERLEDTGDENKEEAPNLKSKLQKILSNKKLLMMFGGGALILLLAIGVVVYNTTSKSEIVAPVQKKEAEEEIIKEKKEPIDIEKVNIYKLDPFFVPILENGKDTGKFISLSANLLLSNSALNKEIERVLPLVRKKIYGILQRKRLHNFTQNRSNIEQRIKKEIIAASNSLLLTGTGTVTDVLFTRFIIK